MAKDHPSQPITNVFVLMLENRSFDHLLGFSGITGLDAETGQPTQVNGLAGSESNAFNGIVYPVSQPADLVMPVDPAHEFPNVVKQLGGISATYAPGGSYPPIDNSGFVADYATVARQSDPAEIMKCYTTPHQLPVLYALATEFAVCDSWFSSVPGPTWPNRFFAHAASSGGLDHSPTAAQIVEWEVRIPSGFSFEHGTIFDVLKSELSAGWRIYRDGLFAVVTALKGILITDTLPFARFAADLSSPSYPWAFTWIEPNYGDVAHNSYVNGNSQHPLDDVTHGEALIKTTYEAIRQSPLWEHSLLIVTWDEHGGFYDHVVPPAAVAPGDQTATAGNVNQFGFTFQQSGPRVPAVVVSAYTPKNVIDHRGYEHASIPATVEALFDLSPLTERDAAVNNVTSLVSLAAPRTDAPMWLPSPAASLKPSASMLVPPPVSIPGDSIDHGNQPGFLHLALRSDLALSPVVEHPAIKARVAAIKTPAAREEYIQEVEYKIRASDAASVSAATH